MPNSVTPNMPANTAVPSEWRISAPAPVATTSGKTPRMKANDVIRIGRSRSREASTVASKRGLPSWCNCLANSTMRMAFLHANPTSTTRPICTKMSTDRCANSTPATEHSRHIGTTRMTASGSDQLSYRADSARKTASTASANTTTVVLPSRICRKINSVHSVPIERGSVSLASAFISAMAVAGTGPRQQAAGDGSGGVEIVALHEDRAADLARVDQGAQRHHEPLVVADIKQVDIVDPRAELAFAPGG